jgi:AraC family transcriptional regulator
MLQVFHDGTLGSKVRELALPAFNLTEARFTPSQVLPWHAHERASLCVVLDGNYVEQFRSAQYQLSPFDVTYKPDGTEHRDRYDASAGAQCLIIDLEQSWLDALAEKGSVLDQPWFFSSGANPETGRRMYGEFVEPDDLSGLAVETICADLIVQATRSARVAPASRTPLWLQRVREFLHADCQQRLTLEQLAGIADVHPVHLAQTFRMVYACTIGEYVRNLRVRRAAEELTRTDRPLAEIAIDCGFYDQSHFNRVFKKHMKVTPARYRKRRGVAA